MIKVDLHNHTKYSHGQNTPSEMYTSAVQKGLEVIGFSEHSPRPKGFDYTHEYRDMLKLHLQDYVREVCALKGQKVKVLFGMEMDWLEGELDFVTKAAGSFDFDYLIGSVHFLGHWGFDDGGQPWEEASQEECEAWYVAYFTLWQDMIKSGLYNIAAHPDLIKIFSRPQFHIWLAKASSQQMIRQALCILKEVGMAMEISSAGLRKPCCEIYPAQPIMQLAREVAVDITFASDAHNVSDVAYGFAELERYAKAFGFQQHVVFEHGKKILYPL
ncbi:MAG: histidinol-phosphatase [Desulfovibrio sp.]|nr:histidinol-phosphatase [Desulfovibrio sp.]